MNTRRSILIAISAAAVVGAATAKRLNGRTPRRSMDQMTVVIRSEGSTFVLDTYYEGQTKTSKPLAPKDLVPYLTNEVQTGARIIDITGKVHVVQW
jgi:hypothetical protein